MKHKMKLLSVVLASCLVIAAARSKLESNSRSSLLTRLKLEEEGPSTCWDALLKLQSCSGEVVIFFLNGETHLGANCCSAITVIERQCWPSMLGTIGITTAESNILRGYCDAAAAAPPPLPPTGLMDQCYNFPRLHH